MAGGHSAKSSARSGSTKIIRVPLRVTLHPLRLTDHSIGAREHVRWNCETDLFGGFQIDHEFKLGRLLDWKVGRGCASTIEPVIGRSNGLARTALKHEVHSRVENLCTAEYGDPMATGRGILYEVLEPNQSNSIGVGSFVSAGSPWRGFHVEMF